MQYKPGVSIKRYLKSKSGRLLLFWFLLFFLIPLVIFTLIHLNYTRNTLLNTAGEELSIINKLQSDNLVSYFKNANEDLRYLAMNKSVMVFLEQLKALFRKSNMTLSKFVNSSSWQDLKETEGEFLKEFKVNYNYEDIYLIDDEGNILFSVGEKRDLGKNLSLEELTDTQFSKTCYAAYLSDYTLYSNIELYLPSGNKPASFLVKRIFNGNGKNSGLIALQIPMSVINAIMKTYSTKKSLESFIIGTDRLMRSQAGNVNYSTTMMISVEAEWLNEILTEPENNSGPGNMTGNHYWVEYHDYRNIVVEGIYREVEIYGIKLVIHTKVDKAEILIPVRNIEYTVALMIFFSIIVVFILVLLVSYKITIPVFSLVEWVHNIATGALYIPDIKIPRNETGEIFQHLAAAVHSQKYLAAICEAIAVGDFSQSVPVRSADDKLAISIKKIVENYRNIVLQAKKVTAGDYSLLFKPHSDEDELGNAFYDMISALRYLNNKNSNENWLKTGINELIKRIQGTQRINTLCDTIIRFICIYLNIKVGILYVNTDNRFEMISHYALTELDSRQKIFKYNEGIIGQAAREKKIQMLTSFPENYIRIQSGLVDLAPSLIVIIPLLFEKNVVAVMELGIIEELNDLQLNFLKQAASTIAININLTLLHDKLKASLDRAEKQKLELEHQKEELRVSNEELEEQTIRLQESEKRLQQQQEELRQTNEELEEHTNLLKKQKEQLQKKTLEIAENAAELQKISKYKSEFLANMSHELRTPLNSMLLLAQLLAENRDKNLSKKQVEFASTIFSSGNDLLTLINEILDLAKIEAQKITLRIDKINIQNMVNGLQDIFLPVADKNKLVFETNVHKDLPEFIVSDEQRLTQIIKNLLSNAFKFTHQGSVKLNIYHPKRESTLLKDHLKPESTIAFEVTDTGIGIPHDKQKIIFEAFQQVDAGISRRYGGTGLGLSICRELVKLLKGEILLSSEEGTGSRFTVFLPVDYENSKPVKKAFVINNDDQTKTGAPPSRSFILEPGQPQMVLEDDRNHISENDNVILLIEDDPKFAEVLLNLTRERGFKGLVALRGDQGLDMVKEYNPKGILLDLTLPGIDGWSVLYRLKDDIKTRHIPVHIISGTDKEIQGLQMGAVGFLKKPVTIEQLNDALLKIEKVANSKVRKLLVIEDNKDQLEAIRSQLGGSDLEITAVNTGDRAYQQLFLNSFDCIVLDLALPDMSGFDLLKKIRLSESIAHIPIIIYTGKELSDQERYELKEYAEMIIIKDATSLELLLDQTSLFLHRVEKDLSEQKKKIIKKIHNREEIFTGKKLLIVDDDMRNVFALSAIFEENGLIVEIARNGRECLELLEKKKDIDLILMDIMMPVMDGYEAMEHVRKMEHYRSVPIIALTAKAMKGDKEKCVQAGASDYLAKPVNTDQLLSLLRVWLYKGI